VLGAYAQFKTNKLPVIFVLPVFVPLVLALPG